MREKRRARAREMERVVPAARLLLAFMPEREACPSPPHLHARQEGMPSPPCLHTEERGVHIEREALALIEDTGEGVAGDRDARLLLA